MEAILSSFGLVAISEMGDKTQLLAFSLAARFRRPWAVMAGILVATVFNHALASCFGQWVASQLSPPVMAWILCATFIGFGIWTLRPDTLEESSRDPRAGAWVTTATLFFLAEMGDKTQLATVALSAKFQSIFAVTVGTTAGMLLTDGLAVFLGERIAGKVQAKWIRFFSAVTFMAFGIASGVTAYFLAP